MREIKFRAKELGTGEWVIGDLRILCTRPHIHNFLYSPSKKYIDMSTIGQFTGQHDKNGKEIYEGDIVKHSLFDFFDNEEQHKSVVEYCNGMAAFFVKLSEDSDYGSYLELGWVYKEDQEIEVIGNVYDNPELLKQ